MMRGDNRELHGNNSDVLSCRRNRNYAIQAALSYADDNKINERHR